MTKPGRPAVASSPYRKRHLSSDARVMKALLKKQPQNAGELCKNAMISPRTLYFLMPFLIESEIIKKTSSGYALWTFSELGEDVENALLRLIKKGDTFTVEDLATEVGKPWSEIETLAHGILKKHGLRIRTVNGNRHIQGWDEPFVASVPMP